MKKLATILFTLVFASAASGQKISTEELLQKHLESFATAEKRSKVKNISAVGESSFVQGSNFQRASVGKSVFAAEGNKFAIAMTFPLDNYPMDRIIYDGKDLTIPFVVPGNRSPLGEYLIRNEEITKEGVFGGILSQNWVSFKGDQMKGSLSNVSTRKLDGNEVYVVTYSTKAGSGIDIKLFFDAKTFRHVRTTYRRVISAQMGPTPEMSARQSETVEDASEEFSDFATEGGITLPKKYTVKMSTSVSRSRSFIYSLTFAKFYYDQDLDAATFTLSK